MQAAIQEASSAGATDDFPEETRWQIRLLLPSLRPEGSAASQPIPEAPARPQPQQASAQALPRFEGQEGTSCQTCINRFAVLVHKSASLAGGRSLEAL